MNEKEKPAGVSDRAAEEKMIRQAERGPTAVGQGEDEHETGADSARGMQTGAENDLTDDDAEHDPPADRKQGGPKPPAV